MAKTEYPKLPPVFKRKWLAALRSGEYKQGREQLRKEDEAGKATYCCLGVACKITGRGFDGQRGSVPGSFSGVPRMIRGPGIGEDDVPTKLMEMNDSGAWSFCRIANWIEKHL